VNAITVHSHALGSIQINIVRQMARQRLGIFALALFSHLLNRIGL